MLYEVITIEGPALEGPASMEWLGANALRSGDVIDTTIVLKNVGNYPASYSISAYSYIKNITPAEGVILANDSVSVHLSVDLTDRSASSSSNTTLSVAYVITSYSIHYTKLYDWVLYFL